MPVHFRGFDENIPTVDSSSIRGSRGESGREAHSTSFVRSPSDALPRSSSAHSPAMGVDSSSRSGSSSTGVSSVTGVGQRNAGIAARWLLSLCQLSEELAQHRHFLRPVIRFNFLTLVSYSIFLLQIAILHLQTVTAVEVFPYTRFSTPFFFVSVSASFSLSFFW